MKRLVFTILLSAALALGAFGQEKGAGRHDGFKRLQAEKIALISSELDLSPSEAEAFWPVYNQAQKEMREDFKAGMQSFKALQEALEKNLPEEQLQPLLAAWLSSRSKNAIVAHQDDFVKLIGAAKTAKLYVLEEEFRNRQIRRLSSRKHGE